MIKFTFANIFMVLFTVVYSQNLPEFIKERDTILHITNLMNEVKLNIYHSDPSKINIKVEDATVMKINDSLYNVKYTNPADEAKIKLYYKNLPVDVMTVTVKNMIMPDIIVSGKNGGKVSSSDFQNLNSIQLNFPPDFPSSLTVDVVSCNVTVKKIGATNLTFSLRGLEIPENIKGIFAGLKSGDKVIFDQMRVKANNTLLSLNSKPVTFEIN